MDTSREDTTMAMDVDPTTDSSYRSEPPTMAMDMTTHENLMNSTTLSSSSFMDSSSAAASAPAGPLPPKPTSMLPSSYLDIDDILAESERISCEFTTDLFGLGILDPSTDSKSISEGTKLELPLWLAKDLYQKGWINVDTPKGYNEAYRELLNADPTVVDLHKLGPNFYKFGEKLILMELDDNSEIAYSLEETFYDRIHSIIDHSLNIKSQTLPEGKEFTKRLDNLEMQLYEVGKKTAQEYQMWEEKKLDKISANAMVIDIKRRKQAALNACASNVHASSEKTLL